MEDNVKFVARETKEEVSKLRRVENFLIENVVFNPAAWAAGAGIIACVTCYKYGSKSGYAKGIKVGAGTILKDYTSVLNAYDVKMPKDLARDVRLGKIYFLKPGA